MRHLASLALIRFEREGQRCEVGSRHMKRQPHREGLAIVADETAIRRWEDGVPSRLDVVVERLIGTECPHECVGGIDVVRCERFATEECVYDVESGQR